MPDCVRKLSATDQSCDRSTDPVRPRIYNSGGIDAAFERPHAGGGTVGYRHSSIPLAAKTIEEMGKKTGAWTSTTSWDLKDINAGNVFGDLKADDTPSRKKSW